MMMQKLLLGVTLAAPIGPVSIAMIKRGLKDGFWGAFNVRLGGAVGNTLCLVAAFFGLSALKQYPSVLLVMGMVGSGLLLYMGSTTLVKALKPLNLDLNAEATHQKHPLLESMVLGFMLAIFNPIGVVFWLSIFANDINPDKGVHWLDLFSNLQIIAGVLLWGALLSLAVEFGRRSLNANLLKLITFISGVILLYFGVKYGMTNLESFFLPH